VELHEAEGIGPGGRVSGCEYGPEGECGRKVAARGMCHSHRRMWLAGKPLDAPVRGYQRYETGPDGEVQARSAPSPRRRKPPFEAEVKLLKELGLR
jgi:hypothetical protein